MRKDGSLNSVSNDIDVLPKTEKLNLKEFFIFYNEYIRLNLYSNSLNITKYNELVTKLRSVISRSDGR